MTAEYGRLKKDEVSGYLHCEGDPDDYSQGFVQHQGPVGGKSGKDQRGCWENAGKMRFSTVNFMSFFNWYYFITCGFKKKTCKIFHVLDHFFTL